MRMPNPTNWGAGLGLAMLLGACGRPPLPPVGIEGQIVVWTETGETLRPAGVPVMLVASNAAVAYVQSAQRDAATNLPDLAKQAAQVDKDLDLQVSHARALLENLDGLNRSRDGLNTVLKKVGQVVEDSKSKEVQDKLTEEQRAEQATTVTEIIDNSTVLQKNLATLRRKESDWKTQLTEISNRIAELRIRRIDLRGDLMNPALRRLVAQPWPFAVQTTATGTDGRFVFPAPPGTNLLLVALGKREQLGVSRDCLWLLPPPASAGTTLLLNNANLYSAGENKSP